MPRAERLFLGAASAVILGLALVASMFVGSSAAHNLGDIAQQVNKLEESQASVEMAAAQISWAIGTDPAAVDLAREAAASLTLLAGRLPNDSPPALLEQAAVVMSSADEVVDLLEAGDQDAAVASYQSLFQPASATLTSSLRADRNILVAELNRASSTTGRIADALKLIAFIAVPLIAVLSAFAIFRRHLARKETDLVSQNEKRVTAFKDEFLKNVSHELRTPLTGVVGFAHLLAESPLSDTGSEAVKLIISESAELSRMVDDLLTSARGDAGLLLIQPERVSVTDQVAEVVEFMKLLGAEVAIQCQEARIVVDPERFRQMLRNLLVNAHQHGLPGIRVTGQVYDGTYVLHVVDSGPGVRTEVEKRLFTRFYHPSGGHLNGSLGLGLSVVHTLGELMGCEVSYRRIRGETHFVLAVPLETTAAMPSERDLVAV